MDFDNYTMGGLFRDRRNYDDKHVEHQKAISVLFGTLWNFGWRDSTFGQRDRYLSESRYRTHRNDVERYGKKYGWIAYYNYVGHLQDVGLLSKTDRLSEVQIDPSFPSKPKALDLALPNWADSGSASERRWITSGAVEVPEQLYFSKTIDGVEGPWILVSGNLDIDSSKGRYVWAHFDSMLVASKDATQLVSYIQSRGARDNFWSDLSPSDYYTFAGEIPWSREFGTRNVEGDPLQQYRRSVQISKTKFVEVEFLDHHFNWESYHSNLNAAGHPVIPSLSFCRSLNTRSASWGFNQVLSNNSAASLSVSAPKGFSGTLLYIREDLLKQFAGERTLVLVVNGERSLKNYVYQIPDWLRAVFNKESQAWRVVTRIENISPSWKARKA